MTIVLRHEDIAGILTLDEVREAVLGGLREQAAGHVQLPPRTTIDATSNRAWLRVMPAILNKSGIMGYKAMHSNPGFGVRYLVMLYDLETGELLTQMDADWLTAQRTAATAAIAADLLASPTVGAVGVLGSSDQARTMLAAVARVRKLPRIKVFSPTLAHRKAFADQMSDQLSLPIAPVDSPREAISEADLVVSIYRAGTEPLISADWLKEGSHLNAGSSIRPEARELKDDVWERCSVVAVDDRAHALESGDGRNAVASGAIRGGQPVELWELIGNKKLGRRSGDDITLFKGVGTALQDLALAAAIFRRATSRGLGQAIGHFPRARR